MTNNELNKYIRHYIEKDRTNRAMMLTGPWGCGKSYYIREELIPYLSKEDHGNHSCIVVSLYGLTDLHDVSKAVYMEARFGAVTPKTERGQTASLTAKTVLKGVAGFFGIDLSADSGDLQKLYESVNLAGKLIIFEDVERTQIDIFEFLGYVNNLTEQDGVKVLLVTNEAEFIRYKPIEVAKEGDRKTAELFAHITGNESREYAEETKKYLKEKEKTVGDTIQFEGDIKTAVKQIMRKFNNDLLASFANEITAGDMQGLMGIIGSSNLRSIVFACQKTVDIYERIPKGNDYTEDFFRTIFYGIVSFSIRMNRGDRTKWIGMDRYSLELGAPKHPLFHFCYDYIMTQQLDEAQFPVAADALKYLRLYDEHKTQSDPDLQKISGYYRFSESEVCAAIKRVSERLHNPEDISFYDYGRLAFRLIEISFRLGIDISDAKDSLIRNLQGRGNELPQETIFVPVPSQEDPEISEEYMKQRASMIESLNYEASPVSHFEYKPENAEAFYHLAIDNDKQYYAQKGFAKHLDIARLIEMFIASSAEEMDYIRSAFISLYRRDGAKFYLADDADTITRLLQGLTEKRNSAITKDKMDKIQVLQYDWFIKTLKAILADL